MCDTCDIVISLLEHDQCICILHEQWLHPNRGVLAMCNHEAMKADTSHFEFAVPSTYPHETRNIHATYENMLHLLSANPIYHRTVPLLPTSVTVDTIFL